MKARHPAAFPTQPLPLKVGIRDDLIAAGWDEREVGVALDFYTLSDRYLRSTYVPGAYRIDLNGCPVAPVQDHEADWARDKERSVLSSPLWGAR
ncbi:hypothetical protein GCM10022276_03100 [Sphingomonas limnosediminicola]|uniref:ProQ/FinO domain-containing protein n=2 Tax=Sphingomonas limnosediminicola TaxID=940133 RepID=A0ABP7KUN9_9SPHN